MNIILNYNIHQQRLTICNIAHFENLEMAPYSVLFRFEAPSSDRGRRIEQGGNLRLEAVPVSILHLNTSLESYLRVCILFYLLYCV